MTARVDGGELASVAGSHPYALTASVGLNPGEHLRNLRLDMPSGLLLNPETTDVCLPSQFGAPRDSPFEASESGESCPDSSQVGTVDVYSSREGGAPRRFGLFSLRPRQGVPAQLGFVPYRLPVAFDMQIRADGTGRYSFGLDAADIPQALAADRLDLNLWGTPWGLAHDGERGDCLNEAEPTFPWAKCSLSTTQKIEPLLTLPTDCDAPLTFTAGLGPWEVAGPEVLTYTAQKNGQPVRPEHCNELAFKPIGFGQLDDRKASSSSGLAFTLFDNDEGLSEPSKRVRSQVRKAVVSLPEGVTINPSLGAGLGVCTPAQYTAEEATVPQGAACPGVAKIGSFTVDTPLFPDPLTGAIYLAQPDDVTTSRPGAENPFDSLLAIYLVAKSTERGVQVKSAGRIDADPATGHLVATFDGLPLLPYTSLELLFRPGQRAPLVTPSTCGPAIARIDLTPWATVPGTSTATASPIESGFDGGACPGGGAAPFTPKAIGGSVNSNVASYTPFYLHLTRNDGEQEITSYSAILPRGLTGRLAGIPFCPEAAIAAARGRTGVAETAQPSCPANSQVGRTLSGYGVGPALAYAPGKVYLAGPYHGSPLSLVTVNAATVGPFDLGTIVIRSAFEVDPRTAQLRIDSRGSDPIPHILKGIPLHLRDIRVFIDRPNFTRNPSSCEPSQVISTLTGSGVLFGDRSDDSTAAVANHFQLLNCRILHFRPQLGLRLRGGSRRGDYPALRAVFAARPGNANLRRIAVTMPHSEFLAQNHIREVCTQSQFAADACPPGSVYGDAVAYTPLFDEPLRGPIYLRSSSHRLPDLVASLRSGSVRIVLEGQIGPAKHGIRTFFDELPDAEISRFVLRLRGGDRGLLVNSANLCAAEPRATVKALGQNNVGSVFTTKLRGQCGNGKGGGKR